MVHAFIMVKTGAGKSEAMVEGVRDLPTVGEAHIVAGDYDVIVEIDDEIYDILKTVSTDIHGLNGVTDTKTYVSLD